ncbi:hypothetical protein ACFUCQ_07105 [Streptomyces sp. NPDC057197]|uniref:hypothetical protein n=1 Tax=unclassified Streptomyces TaxID=2593676 RepID=UPI001331C1B3|nr:hypothetical protein [Streptomyces sp. SAT1]
MEVLGNLIVTAIGSLLTGRGQLTVGVALVSGLLLVGCSSSHDEHASSRTTHTTPSPSASSTAPSQQAAEQRLIAQAQSALDTTAADEKGKFVASGAERVHDGLHTQLGLSKGLEYRVAVVCVGSGDVEVSFHPAEGTKPKTVPCDQSMEMVRFPGSPDLLLEVSGKSNATGAIAWRVSKV